MVTHPWLNFIVHFCRHDSGVIIIMLYYFRHAVSLRLKWIWYTRCCHLLSCDPQIPNFYFKTWRIVFRYFLPLINSYIKSDFGIYTFSKCNDKTWWMQFFVTVFCFSIRSNKIIPLFPVTRPTHCLDPPTGLNFSEFFFFTEDQ